MKHDPTTCDPQEKHFNSKNTLVPSKIMKKIYYPTSNQNVAGMAIFLYVISYYITYYIYDKIKIANKDKNIL